MRLYQGDTHFVRYICLTGTVVPPEGNWYRLQALVYDILPPTTAITDYAIGLRKLSANEQFFVAAQMAVALQQTTQII